MGLFDHLIEKGKQPIEGIEYTVRMDLAASEMYDLPFIAKDTRVKNVTVKTNSRGDHLGYDFEVSENGVKSHTNYPWALAEYTPENSKKIEDYEILYAQLKKLECECDQLRSNIDTLSFKEDERLALEAES